MFFLFQCGQDQEPARRYAQLNRGVPILALFFSEADTKPAFRLSRDSINMLLQMLPLERTHGWGAEMEVMVTLYWLACGASYRVAGDIFCMPLATVCRVVHRTINKMMDSLHRAIHFPKEGWQLGTSWRRSSWRRKAQTRETSSAQKPSADTHLETLYGAGLLPRHLLQMSYHHVWSSMTICEGVVFMAQCK